MEKVINQFVPYGNIKVPSSKSYSHRYLIAAYILNKPVTINNVNLCDDVRMTLEALKTMGAIFTIKDRTINFIKRENVDLSTTLEINVGESGSTLRMLLPIASYLFKNVKFLGKSSLFSRPMGVYKEILESQKVRYEKGEDYILIQGQLKPEEFFIKGNISSQFISGLLFFLAMAQAKKRLTIIPPVESRSYLFMTLNVLEEFGYIFESKEYTFRFLSKTRAQSDVFNVEVDYSLLANFAILGCLKGEIKLELDSFSSLQGDSIILNFLSTLGAFIKFNDDSIVVKESCLVPFSIDIKDCIDLGPILFVLATCIEGKSHFSGTKRLQYKESNRITCLLKELEKIGVSYEAYENEIFINGKEDITGDFIFDSNNDHRLAMALSVLGMNINGKTTIANSECISKSYTTFYEDLESLNNEYNSFDL